MKGQVNAHFGVYDASACGLLITPHSGTNLNPFYKGTSKRTFFGYDASVCGLLITTSFGDKFYAG
jgi:hypothetical protein